MILARKPDRFFLKLLSSLLLLVPAALCPLFFIPTATAADGAGQGIVARGEPVDTTPPFGFFSSPVCGSIVSGSIAVSGWALDEVGLERVSIYRQDGSTLTHLGDATFVEGARPDVEQTYPGLPNNSRAGWGFMMLTNFLPNQGTGTYTLTAVAHDQAGNSEVLGSRTISAENAGAVKPFGSLDTPAPGAVASGTDYRLEGWALTPRPNSIPTCGGTVQVYVDGVPQGSVTYNQYHQEAARLFPGLANSEGAGGYFFLDTTAYQNGVHTIQWTAMDSAGNTDGIGCRYFTIQNNPGADGLFSPSGPKELDPSSAGVDLFQGPSQTFQVDPTGLLGLDLAALFSDGAGTAPFTYAGFQKVGEGLRALPVGSTLFSESGTFHWLPGPAFWGSYELVFTRTGAGV